MVSYSLKTVRNGDGEKERVGDSVQCGACRLSPGPSLGLVNRIWDILYRTVDSATIHFTSTRWQLLH